MSVLNAAQEAAVQAALDLLDLETKARILSGQDMWSRPAVPEIGLASIVMSDGPIGVRGPRWPANDPSVALPSPTALAATWDPQLARSAGRLLGQEARRKGIHVVLAPTVSLHRSPLGGRHFECYSEDPLLTGRIGAGVVAGVPDPGPGPTGNLFCAVSQRPDRLPTSPPMGALGPPHLQCAPSERSVVESRTL